MKPLRFCFRQTPTLIQRLALTQCSIAAPQQYSVPADPSFHCVDYWICIFGTTLLPEERRGSSPSPSDQTLTRVDSVGWRLFLDCSVGSHSNRSVQLGYRSIEPFVPAPAGALAPQHSRSHIRL